MNEREIIEYRHLAGNQTLTALFDEEERRLVGEIVASARDDDTKLRNAAIALEVMRTFRRKITQRAQREPSEETTA